MYTRTGDKVEPGSRPILDKFDPKREERIRVVTESAKEIFEKCGFFFFFFAFSRPGRLVLLGQKVGSQEEVGRRGGGAGLAEHPLCAWAPLKYQGLHLPISFLPSPP